jgi:hypothetical protein
MLKLEPAYLELDEANVLSEVVYALEVDLTHTQSMIHASHPFLEWSEREAVVNAHARLTRQLGICRSNLKLARRHCEGDRQRRS